MKRIFAFIFLLTTMRSFAETMPPAAAYSVLQTNFESQHFAYKSYFNFEFDQTGLLFNRPLYYLENGYPLGVNTPKQDENSVSDQAGEKSFTDKFNGYKLRLTAYLKDLETLRKSMISHWLESRKLLQTPDISIAITPLSNAPAALPVAEPLTTDLPKFIECLKVQTPYLKAAIYYEHFKKSMELQKVQGLLGDTLADEKGPNPSGMPCGKFLGKASFAVEGWLDAAVYAQVFQKDLSPELTKRLLRTLLVLKHSASPGKDTALWNYFWLRLSQLAVFKNDSSDLPTNETLLVDFTHLQSMSNPDPASAVSFRVEWNPSQLAALMKSGETYADGVLP